MEAYVLQYLLFLSLSGCMVPFSYYMVTANGSGFFPVSSTSYLDSPYWLTMSRRTRKLLVIFQLCAAVGYSIFQIWIATEHHHFVGVLSDRWVLVVTLLALLISASQWPIAAFYGIKCPQDGWSVLYACTCLWITAGCGLLYLFASFQERAPIHIVISNIFFCLVVVGADGMVWAALCIRQYLTF